ncbi:MAG: hypothetical protein R3B70_15450 [Polyangiaceae bacterium]
MSEQGTSVFLVRERETYRRLHEAILVETRGEGQSAEAVFEIESIEERPLVEHLLAVTGFSGGDPGSGVRAARVEPGAAEWVKVLGFDVPKALVPSVIGEIQTAMVQGIGGFSEVVIAQGFHGSPYVFKHLWELAGCPAVKLFAPEIVPGRFDPRRPTAIGQHLDRTILASLMRSGVPIPKAPEGEG